MLPVRHVYFIMPYKLLQKSSCAPSFPVNLVHYLKVDVVICGDWQWETAFVYTGFVGLFYVVEDTWQDDKFGENEKWSHLGKWDMIKDELKLGYFLMWINM